MRISIIIVNWNTASLLEKCLDSIFNYAQNIDYEIIVIDNASNDASQKFLSQIQNQNDKIKIIFNEKNLGFARAVNQGTKIASGKYVLLLNPDTEIKKNTLENIIEWMGKNPHCGVCGGKILNPDGTTQPSVRRFPDLFSQSLILLKIHQFLINFLSLRRYFVLDFDYSKTQEVDQVMGAFFMIRKETIDRVGFFDENFFLWFEEVDFCKRVKETGWKIYYYPEAEIIHRGGASFSQVFSVKNQWQFNKSLLYYFKKHHCFLSYLTLLSISPISLFFSLVVFLLPIIKKIKRI